MGKADEMLTDPLLSVALQEEAKVRERVKEVSDYRECHSWVVAAMDSRGVEIGCFQEVFGGSIDPAAWSFQNEVEKFLRSLGRNLGSRWKAGITMGPYASSDDRKATVAAVISGTETKKGVFDLPGAMMAVFIALGYEPMFREHTERARVLDALGLTEDLLVRVGDLENAWDRISKPPSTKGPLSPVAPDPVPQKSQASGVAPAPAPAHVEESVPKPTDPETLRRHAQLRQFANLVLEGVPGTGKTFAYRRWIGAFEAGEQYRTQNRGLRAVDYGQFTFHAATAYEDFIEGLRPGEREPAAGEKRRGSVLVRRGDGGGIVASPELPRVWFYDEPASPSPNPDGQAPRSRDAWTVHDGFFLRACAAAQANPDAAHFVLLDELNRANVPAVLGDLLTLLEPSKRAKWNKTQEHWEVEHAVTLPASRRLFFVPENLYVIATMNTVDRSVAALDQALRRRFAFVRVEPMSAEHLNRKLEEALKKHDARAEFAVVVGAWDKLNAALRSALGANAVLGHCYFFDAVAAVQSGVEVKDALRNMLRYALIPQLIETLRVFGVATEWLGSQGGDGESRKPRAEVVALLKAAGEPALRVTYSEGIIDSYTIDLVASKSTGQ
jgi:hypothetical protein